MTLRIYPAVVEGTEGDYNIFFPDLPGCASAGESVDETIENGLEALELHVEGMIADNDPLPKPTPADKLALEDSPDPVVTIVALPVYLPSKSVRINITMDEGYLKRIDHYINRHGFNRSSFIVEATREFMGRH